MKSLIFALTTSLALIATNASAADESGSAKERPGAGEKGVFVTGKIGGIIPFGGLGPNAIGGIDLGYALDNGLAFGVAADYAAPKKSATENDTRVTGGTYTWHLTQQMLQVMPFLMYRIKSMGTIVPYVGIGPRFYFLASYVRSNEGKPEFQETRETSTKVGVGVPIGIELKAGPGAVIGELLVQYGGLDHTSTGKSNSGAASLSLGYRLMF
jgi:opacity protein-like surface antigen